MSNRIPIDAYAIIIGGMKCGTSSLYNYLKEHPEICPAITKEPEFFSENQGHGFQVDNYNDLWTFNIATHKYALEASTGYTKYPLEPNVPENIFNYGLRPKFIYIIRNPFDRVSSHLNSMRRKDKNCPLNIDDQYPTNVSNYFLQLEQYRKYFLKQDILVLDFDELKGKPSQLLLRTYEFLEISDSHFPEKYDVVNPTHLKLESKIESNLKRSKFGRILCYLPKPFKQFGIKLLLGVYPPPPKRILTDAERGVVYNELKESMVNLHHSYGVDVRKWGFDI